MTVISKLLPLFLLSAFSASLVAADTPRRPNIAFIFFYQWELFDLQNDPEEMNNQYGNPEYKKTRKRLKNVLQKLIKDLDDPVKAPGLVKTQYVQNSAGPVAGGKKSRLITNLGAGKKQTVVAYGTSLTAVGAWVDQLRSVLEQKYPGQVTLINSAQGGSNSTWGRDSLEAKVIQKKPDTVFIEFAVNDAVARRKVSVQQARENLKDMLDRILKARPNCEIILMVMNPPVAHTRKQRPNLAAYNQMYRDVAKERKLRLIDHYPQWERLLNDDPGLFLEYVPDMIHPVRAGALAVITPTMVKAIGLQGGDASANKDAPCWKYLFHVMDQDRNREVTREEFTSNWAKLFNLQDENQDGVIKADELSPLNLFQYMDADADGGVTLDEFQQPQATHFDRRDKNKDDKLSEEEKQLN